MTRPDTNSERNKELDAACWAICPYLTHIDRVHRGIASTFRNCTCKRCPQWEMLDEEKVQRACRAVSEEAVKPVLSAIRKLR